MGRLIDETAGPIHAAPNAGVVIEPVADAAGAVGGAGDNYSSDDNA